MNFELERLEKLYKLYLKMDEYSILLKEDARLSELVNIRIDKEKAVAYIVEDEVEREVDSTNLKVNLGHMLDSVDELLANKNLEYEYLSKSISDEEYIVYAGEICLAKAKYHQISNDLSNL